MAHDVLIRASRRLGAVLTVLLACPSAWAIDSGQLKSVFADPPREYASSPLWVWNDMLTEKQIVDTMNDLAGQKVKQVFVHPRPGLMTPYLSEDWFRLWKIALREAERLDMNVWIYDENSYPSGFAGGFVPEAMPESQGRGLHIREERKAPKWTDKMVGVYRVGEKGCQDVTAQAREGKDLPEGKYLVADVHRAGTSPWYGGKFYVDLLYPGVTEKFLDVTLEAYRKQIGDQFGKRVPGSFTDEPHLRPAGGMPWTDDLASSFEKRWGYSLVENLPSLLRPVGDWKRVRHDYYQLLLDLFIERWGKPYYNWCEKNKIEFTGHYWEHEWPHCIGVPDNMAMYAWHQRPSIDMLMNQYAENTGSQFGNVRAVKELSSVANQLGRARTLCEAYGAGGWDLRFEDMKRIGDWLYVLGVNTLDEHLSYITIRGARKRDHPQSFSYHEPWWNSYHVMAGYFTRLSAAMSAGQQINDVLLIEPTTTAWLYNSEGHRHPELNRIGETFFNVCMAFSRAQVEYDIGCEDIIARNGSTDGGKFVVGKRSYSVVVLPPMTETLNAKTIDLLDAFVKNGGTVLSCGQPPAMVDGRASDRGAAVAKSEGWKAIEAAEAPKAVLAHPGDGFVITRVEGDKGNLFHHRRHLDDGELVFLINTSIETPSAGTLVSPLKGIEAWDLTTGKAVSYPFEATDKGVKASFNLQPCGSLLLFISKAAKEPTPAKAETPTVIAASGAPVAKRIQPNVQTLDYVDVTAGGETKKDAYYYQAGQFAFKKNGMDRNPWDSAVQFKDELITRKFAEDSGFEATYHFTIDGTVPSNLVIVIERADLYSITCNGQPVSPAKDRWWLDKAFGVIELTGAAKAGLNGVTIKAKPFTIYHEIESAYLLGDFSLRAAEKGFVVVADKPVELGPWNKQGMPLYAAGVSYVEKFEVSSPSGRYAVSLPKWYGSVAKVIVNGKPVGHVAWQPWECDVTDQIQAGTNTVEVIVIGTLKNLLGPHHGKVSLGTAWPGMFQHGPSSGPPAGETYHTVGYGLLEPFVLQNRR